MVSGNPCEATCEDVLPQSPMGICCSGCGCAVSFVLMILFFPCTVTQLGQFKIGLSRNKVTGVVDMETTYLPGRYWIGFWKEFIEFPSTLNTIEFSDETPEEGVQHLTILRSRDQEGKQIYLDISIQYKLPPENVGKIYKLMTTEYEDVYISELRDRLTKACNRFTIDQVWRDYHNVSAMFLEECRDALSQRFAYCWGLQLWGVRLDPVYHKKLVDTQVRKQAQQTANATKNNAGVRARTTASLSSYISRISVVKQEGESKRYRLEKNATAQATARIIEAESKVVQIIRETIARVSGVTLTDDQIVMYQKWVRLRTQVHSPVIYNPFGGVLGPTPAVNSQRLMGRRMDVSQEVSLVGDGTVTTPPPAAPSGGIMAEVTGLDGNRRLVGDTVTEQEQDDEDISILRSPPTRRLIPIAKDDVVKKPEVFDHGVRSPKVTAVVSNADASHGQEM